MQGWTADANTEVVWASAARTVSKFIGPCKASVPSGSVVTVSVLLVFIIYELTAPSFLGVVFGDLGNQPIHP